MVKTWKLLASTLIALNCMTAAAFAHDFWLFPDTPETGKNITVKMGFGHDLKAEAIPPTMLALIAPPTLHGEKSGTALVASSDNTEFILDRNLPQGSYIISSSWKPAMWAKGAGDEPVLGSKKDVPDAQRCFQTTRFAKLILTEGNGKNASLSTALGHEIEIIPLIDSGKLIAKSELPIQVLFQGKPKAGMAVTAVSKAADGTLSTTESFTCDQDGKVAIPLTQPGLWLLVARYSQPYPDKTICDLDYYDTSLTFIVQ